MTLVTEPSPEGPRADLEGVQEPENDPAFVTPMLDATPPRVDGHRHSIVHLNMKPSQKPYDWLMLLAGGGATFGLWYAMFGWWGVTAALIFAVVAGALVYSFVRGPAECDEGRGEVAQPELDPKHFPRIDRTVP